MDILQMILMVLATPPRTIIAMIIDSYRRAA